MSKIQVVGWLRFYIVGFAYCSALSSFAAAKKPQDWPPNLSKIDDCYTEYSKFFPFAAGEMIVRYTVTKGTGDLKNLKIVKSSFKEKSIKECVARELLRWQMKSPDPNTDKTYEYPIVFRQGAKVGVDTQHLTIK